MSKKIKQFSLYDNGKWETPINISLEAENIDLEVIDEQSDKILKNVQSIIGNYNDDKSIAEKIEVMRAPTSSTAGVGGLIPAPPHETKVLYGDSTWRVYNDKNFIGTKADWNNLTLAEKIMYDTADLLAGRTITYNANTGAGTMPIDEVLIDENYTIKENTFIYPDGKTFKEWNTMADGTGISYNVGDVIVVSADIMLYAIWENIVGLRFSSDEPFTLKVDVPRWDGTLEYTIDNGRTWSVWNGSELFGTSSNAIYLRGTNNTYISYMFSYDSETKRSVYTFKFTGKYCDGNIETLLDYNTVKNGQHPTMESGCFTGLFQGCTNLIIPPDLPAIQLSSHCYKGMFNGCTSLITAPVLPATTLDYYCYLGMFYDCKSLITPPVLPATVLADSCYMDMFKGCILLSTAPELPATTLKNGCYKRMFTDCNSLLVAPELPAINLKNNSSCYEEMFRYCTSLITPPELPATILSEHCYMNMFNGCSSLIEAPELSAMTLTQDCYRGMFSWCASLTIPPELPATTLAEKCYFDMFSNSGLTTAPELPATTLTNGCYSFMFMGCDNLIIPPILSATILAIECYEGMFRFCENLTTLPILPATTLVDGCYSSMFDSCESAKVSLDYDDVLGYIYEYRVPMTGTGIDATNALQGMFEDAQVDAWDSRWPEETGTIDINTVYYVKNQPV